MTKRTNRKSQASKKVIRCSNGPFEGYYLALTVDSGSSTGWIEVNGESGRYSGGHWEVMQ